MNSPPSYILAVDANPGVISALSENLTRNLNVKFSKFLAGVSSQVPRSANEKANLEVVQTLCRILDELAPRADGLSYSTQITFVADRPGHDRRYAIDAALVQ